MVNHRKTLAGAAFAGLALASPAPQQLDFAAIAAAPSVANGPSLIATAANQTATIYTSVSISGVATASATGTSVTGNGRRDYIPTNTPTGTGYTPYYPALATGYTTDPALTATTSAGQACPTTPEAGTYCGFINPEDPCAPQPDGYGPVPSPDTPSAFLADPTLHSLANAAPTSVPSTNNTQYTQVFKDLNGAVSAQSYIGLYVLKSYDVAGCAAKCDSTALCTAFNIYIERDPSLNPSANDTSAPSVWGHWCPNPPSMTDFKCTLWGSNIDASMATNTGQTREQFQVVITGSDGYDKTNNTTPPPCTLPPVTTTPKVSTSSSVATSTWTSTAAPPPPGHNNPPPPNGPGSNPPGHGGPGGPSGPGSNPPGHGGPGGPSGPGSNPPGPHGPSGPGGPPGTSPNPQNPWGPPQNCHGRGISSPQHCMGSQFFPGPFNAQVCSDFAYFQNLANAAAGNGQQCQMFNAYYLHKNGKPLGTYCNLFNTFLDTSYATFSGARSSNGDQYDCQQSWTFTWNN